ncbi:Putative glycosyltransferase [uncultured Gammaproteobacteria bacterium]|nr:Putative glycosyltransferase [uncultured Gammaproteobacteria bacterium]
MYSYCTLFDSNYLTRGLAMYESLKHHSDNFHLYIFAFDDKSHVLLKKLDLKYCTVISLREFENEKLLAIKPSRTKGEYCWTCTPSTIKYTLEKYNLESCIYLDADLYFFSNPDVLIKEMNDKSVLITEHRYTPKYDQTKTSGKYCVQFMSFKNNDEGMKVLNWWVDACIDWCYARFENGKFGDQKYLDDWMTRFEYVHELQNLGGGVAPWNVQQYDLSDENFKLVFYHFHNFKRLENNKVDLGSYKLNKSDFEILYKPYVRHLEKITQFLKTIDGENDYNGIVKNTPLQWKDPIRFALKKLKGEWNIFNKQYFLRED